MSVATSIAPSVLWQQDPKDLSTLVDVLNEQAREASRRSRKG